MPVTGMQTVVQAGGPNPSMKQVNTYFGVDYGWCISTVKPSDVPKEKLRQKAKLDEYLKSRR